MIAEEYLLGAADYQLAGDRSRTEDPAGRLKIGDPFDDQYTRWMCGARLRVHFMSGRGLAW
jgi:hypothetical protein